MKTIVVSNTEYKIKYGFNSFADTDLLDRVQDVAKMFQIDEINSDADASQMGKIRDLFVIVRELLFVGLQKYNPLNSLEETGNLLDEYREEATEDEDRSLFGIFSMLTTELTEEGFLADLMNQAQTNIKSIPQDHKTATKKSSRTVK